MAVHFHPLRIHKITRETPDCVVIEFDIPVNLVPEFRYKEGQNVTLKTQLGGEDIRRSYSICSAPGEGKLSVAVKKVEGGLFSSFANAALKPGNVLEVLPPTGNFFSKDVAPGPQNYLAIAAGSGITPVISILKHCLHNYPESTFTLLYGNKSSQSIIFFDELEDLKNKFMERLQVIHILSRENTDIPLQSGRIDKDKLGLLGKVLNYKSFDEIFLCGPEQLIFTSQEYLLKLGIPGTKIHFELFTIPGQAKSSVETSDIPTNAGTTGPAANITIKLDGRSFDFPLEFDGINILDAALRQGADLPYACKGGVCCTCKARLLSGEIIMDVNYALEPEEVEQGYILTCQSHPRTANVVVDFDVK